MDWEMLDSGRLPAEQIMRKDASLLEHLHPESKPLLHFYEWEAPSLTYGCFIKPEKHLDMQTLKMLNWQAAQRPTGGGLIFHLTDFAFSALVPASHPNFSLNTLENYALINRLVAKVIFPFLAKDLTPELLNLTEKADYPLTPFCMAKSTQYDLVVHCKKVAGAAQRRTKKGFLHQGTISLLIPPFELIEKVLVDKKRIISAMKENSFALFPFEQSPSSLEEAKNLIKSHFRLVALRG